MYKKSDITVVKTFVDINEEELEVINGGWGYTNNNVVVSTQAVLEIAVAGVFAVAAAGAVVLT